MIENAIFIEEQKMVRIISLTVIEGADTYYDHALTRIEKTTSSIKWTW